MVAALALGERENDHGVCEYGGAREYGAREDGVREYDRESYSQNAFKTGHFALATERAPSTWIIDSGASHHMYNGPRSRFRTYSRHTEIAVLPDKRAETCTTAFQWLQANIDGWGYDIRRFRSDNGSGEYNKMFRSILAARGIAFEPCPPHTQHKNGIAERMIGVLTQKARAMMLDSQAPIHFWAEAINTACYLHRRTPNQSLDGKTPYEVLKRHRRLYRSGCNSQLTACEYDSDAGRQLSV
jgi:hypothetical protein